MFSTTSTLQEPWGINIYLLERDLITDNKQYLHFKIGIIFSQSLINLVPVGASTPRLRAAAPTSCVKETFSSWTKCCNHSQASSQLEKCPESYPEASGTCTALHPTYTPTICPHTHRVTQPFVHLTKQASQHGCLYRISVSVCLHVSTEEGFRHWHFT